MASKKGVSALQIGRMLGLSKKTAWFLCHRIRESLRETKIEPLGGKGKTVEMDESFVGGLEKNKHRSKRKHKGTGGIGKEAVYALVERGGRVQSHHVPGGECGEPWADYRGANSRRFLCLHGRRCRVQKARTDV